MWERIFGCCPAAVRATAKSLFPKALGLVLANGFLGSLGQAQTLIDEDTVQTGGNVDTPGNGLLTITHSSNNPLLTLQSEAVRNSEAVIVGSASGESGRLRVEGGSVLNNTLGEPFQVVDTVNGIDLFTGTGVIGLSAGSVGEATVTGAGSSWINSDSLIVGQQGSGTLNVLGGATVSSVFGALGLDTGSTGIATISGMGSSWNSNAVYVGYFGAGELTIEAGATVNTTTDDFDSTFGAIGFFGNGSVTITGAGSSWNLSDEMYVGFESQGVLNVLDGASFTNEDVYLGVGQSGTGKITISGAGSSLNTEWISVGSIGSGELVIDDEGSLSSGMAVIGEYFNHSFDDFPGISGKAVVSGSGSSWNISQTLVTGSGGVGHLRIEDGGRVSAFSTVVAAELESSGSITVNGSGSTLSVTEDLIVGLGDTGILTVSDGGLVEVGGVLRIDSGGILTGDGGVVRGNVLNSGLLAPGNSIGQLTIDGNYTQEDGGMLEIELGGFLEGFLYDQLVVTGDAVLSGDLSVSLTNGFQLGLNQSFDILTVSGTLTGFFNGLEHESLVGSFDGIDLFIAYAASGPMAGVQLFTVPEPSSLIFLFLGLGVSLSRVRRSRA